MADSPRSGANGELDLDAVREMASECGWTLGEFVEFYVSGTGKQIDRIGEGITAGDAEEVRRLAHGAVGSSASARVDSMADLFREMELAAGAGRLDEVAAVLERVRRRFADVSGTLNGALAG